MGILAVMNAKNSVSCSARTENAFNGVVRFFAYCFFYFYYFFNGLNYTPKAKHGLA